MSAIRDHLGIHADALAVRETRTKLLASNIANAGTPHFKARDFDFTAALERARSDGGRAGTTHPRHIALGASGAADPGYRVPVNPALDGNTVELNVEQMEFAENTLGYMTSLQLLNGKISGLKRAIKGQ